jgi:hypothetical protein
MLSGYLGYFYDLDRNSGASRSCYTASVGVSAFVSSFLYGSSTHLSQPLYGSAPFFHTHPLFASLLLLGAGVLVFFVLLVFSEKFGFMDDGDCERPRLPAPAYLPVSESVTEPVTD